MIDDVVMFNTTSFAQKRYSLTPVITNLWLHKMREKDVVGIVTFDLIGSLPTNHIIAYITMAYRRFLRKSLMLTAKTMQNIWNFIVGKSSLQEMATSAIILEISDSNLESGRYGPKSGVSGIIRESWQPYFCLRPWNMAVNSVVAASFLVNTSIRWEKWRSVHCSHTLLICLWYVAARGPVPTVILYLQHIRTYSPTNKIIMVLCQYTYTCKVDLL